MSDAFRPPPGHPPFRAIAMAAFPFVALGDHRRLRTIGRVGGGN